MAEETIQQQPDVFEGTVIKEMHPHPFAYLVYYLGGLFIGLAGFWYGALYAVVGTLVLIGGEVMRRSETLVILEEGVVRNFTLLSRTNIFFAYDMIRSVIVTQGFFERLFGLGTITLVTTDTEEGKIQFGGVREPFAVGEVIQSHISQE